MQSSLFQSDTLVIGMMKKYSDLMSSSNISELAKSIEMREKIMRETLRNTEEIKSEIANCKMLLHNCTAELSILNDKADGIIRSTEVLRGRLTTLKPNVNAYTLRERELETLVSRESERKWILNSVLSSTNFIEKHIHKCGILGMLYNLIRPKNHKLVIPILSVLGPAATNTLVVMSRLDAIYCADILKHSTDASIRNIDIVNELPSSASPSSKALGSRDGRCSALLNHIEILNPLVDAVVVKKLSQWSLFKGSSGDAIRYIATSKLTTNVMSSDGYKFYCDGEIRTYEGGNEVWPGSVIDIATEIDDNTIASTLERVRLDISDTATSAQKLELEIQQKEKSRQTLKLDIRRLEDERLSLTTKLYTLMEFKFPDTSLDEERINLDKALLVSMEQSHRELIHEALVSIQGCIGSDTKCLNQLKSEVDEYIALRAKVASDKAK